MFRQRKNLVAVAKAAGLGIIESYTYYLSKFKTSDDYRLLKAVCEEERQERHAASDQGLDACGICGDGGNLLICDGCEGEYHMTCMRPPLAEVPEGSWFCDSCVDSKFLEATDSVIERFFVEVDDACRKRKADEVALGGPLEDLEQTQRTSMEVMVRPSHRVMKAVKALALCIDEALTP